MNLVENMKIGKSEIEEKMMAYFTTADPDYGKRVSEGLWKVRRMMDPVSTAEVDMLMKRAKEMRVPSDAH